MYCSLVRLLFNQPMSSKYNREFLKKTNPVPSYGPKRDGAPHRDSRRLSRFRTNFTKIGLEVLRGKISAQFKKGVTHNIIPQFWAKMNCLHAMGRVIFFGGN